MKWSYFVCILCLLCLYSHHSWVSFEGSAEIYNETMRETKNFNYLNLMDYVKKHPMRNTGNCDIMINTVNDK